MQELAPFAIGPNAYAEAGPFDGCRLSQRAKISGNPLLLSGLGTHPCSIHNERPLFFADDREERNVKLDQTGRAGSGTFSLSIRALG